MPKMTKKDDPFMTLQAEAAESGITIIRAQDGTFAGNAPGGASLEDYADARELLDDLLALKEMDASDSLYTYDATEFDEAQVSVNGGGTFTAPSFAAAFAAAKASVLEKAKPAKLRAVDSEDEEPAAKPKRAYTKKSEQHISSEDPGIGSAMTPEILTPTKPNGGKAADLSDTLAEACLTMAQTLTELAGKLRSSDALLPFRGGGFTEEEATDLPERKVLKTQRGK